MPRNNENMPGDKANKPSDNEVKTIDKESMPPLTEAFFRFIDTNKNSDPSALRLKYHGKTEDFDLNFALTQIECRKRTVRKLHSFINNPRFLFPSVISSEQASHSAVATFHGSLIREGSTLLDMTAGLGIDVMIMARHCRTVTAIELDRIKADVLEYNCRLIGKENIRVICGDSVDWLRNSSDKFDVIFIDPLYYTHLRAHER